jgi:predicted AAA+ superfamily ATPase
MILEMLKHFRIVSINGPRQTGKTTLAKHIADTLDMEYFTFDKDTTFKTAQLDPINFVDQVSKKPCVVDEIQLVPQIIKALKLSVDQVNQNGMFLLTGSADIVKMSSIKESLAGRMVSVDLYPFSQYELKGKSSNIIDILFSKEFTTLSIENITLEHITNVIISGSYPSVYNKPKRLIHNWFETYIQARVEKDLSLIKRITNDNKSEVLKLLKLLANNTASILKYNSLAQHLSIKDMTVKSNIEILEALYLVKRLKPYFTNKGKREIKSPKIHFVDTGLVSHLLGVDANSLILEDRKTLGHLLENFVYSELLKHTTYSQNITQLYHYKDGDKEVDIVCEQNNGKIIGIEIKSSATIKTTDLNGLVRLAKNSGNKFINGFVFYTGNEILPMPKDGFTFWLLPAGCLF